MVSHNFQSKTGGRRIPLIAYLFPDKGSVGLFLIIGNRSTLHTRVCTHDLLFILDVLNISYLVQVNFYKLLVEDSFI